MSFGSSFSIVIPVLDGRAYIAEAIDSILGQTFQDFTTYVLDNHSSDGTPEFAEAYRDPRIVVLRSPTRLSMVDNWRRISSLQLDDYLTVLSHDDKLYPDFLTEIASLIEAEPQASLYHTHFDLIGSSGEWIRACQPIPYAESAEDFLVARHRGTRESYGTGYVMRSKDFTASGGFSESFPQLFYADDVAWYKLTAISYKVCSPRTLFAYRMHELSASQSMDLASLYSSSVEYLRFLRGTPFGASRRRLSEARRYVGRQFRGWYHKYLVDLIEAGNEEQMRQYRLLRSRLLQWSRVHGEFRAYDLPSRVYEMAGDVPCQSVRKMLLKGIRAVRRWRQHLRGGQAGAGQRPT